MILGAGIAGLTSAYELGKAGYKVTLLEALRRPGGRNWTVRGGTQETDLKGVTQRAKLSPGQYMNAGPGRIPQHHLTLEPSRTRSSRRSAGRSSCTAPRSSGCATPPTVSRWSTARDSGRGNSRRLRDLRAGAAHRRHGPVQPAHRHHRRAAVRPADERRQARHRVLPPLVGTRPPDLRRHHHQQPRPGEHLVLSPAARFERAIAQGTKIHGDVYSQDIKASFSVDWASTEYSRGSWVGWPSQTDGIYAKLLDATGNIYLAGDHLSHTIAWRHGAIVSARATVTSLHSRVMSR